MIISMLINFIAGTMLFVTMYRLDSPANTVKPPAWIMYTLLILGVLNWTFFGAAIGTLVRG